MKALALAAALVACSSGYDDAELDRLHDEAIRANAQKLAALGPAHGAPGFSLAVAGQLERPLLLQWPELQTMATSHLTTFNIEDQSAPDKLVDFRGVLVRDLLATVKAQPAATEVTFVAVDGFRCTFTIADLRKYRVMLAVAADDKPIARSMGGPIFLVLPYAEAPELRARYPDRYWAFYVEAVIVGTEQINLRVGGERFGRAQLENLPQVSFDDRVWWKIEWPPDKVHLRGVKVTDVFEAAHIPLPPDGKIIFRGKAATTHDPALPITMKVADLARCQPMIALRYGPDDEPIPARLGGPIGIAMPHGDNPENNCDNEYGEHIWMTFAEQLLVGTE
jgi:hypothetical protein